MLETHIINDNVRMGLCQGWTGSTGCVQAALEIKTCNTRLKFLLCFFYQPEAYKVTDLSTHIQNLILN